MVKRGGGRYLKIKSLENLESLQDSSQVGS